MFLLFLLCTLSLTNAVQDFTKANNLFARDIYQQLSKSNGNILVSPLSAEVVLALTQSGARGKSAQELRQALHLPNNKEKVESTLKTLLPQLTSSHFTLQTANKIYIKKNLEIKQSFQKSASQVYQAQSETVDFTESVKTAKLINKWVKQNTNNKIENLINSEDLDELTRAVIINALYFKANWTKQFLLTQTEEGKFFRTPSDHVQVKMLNQYDEWFKYYDCPHLKAQFLELPLQGGASFVVVLPNEKNGISRLEKEIDQVLAPQHQLKREIVNVKIPKFRIESFVELQKVLDKLGVKEIFDKDKADLSNLAGKKGDLYVNKAVQKTFIDVSEDGVEAAAASYVLVPVPISAPLGEPKRFVADHPFIFYVKVKDLVLFVGRVVDPSKH